MKKSLIYKKAISAVIRDEAIKMDETIEILDVLMSDMNLAKFGEERSEKEADAE